MKKLTLEIDDSYFELKKADKGMMWVGTCIYCACDVAIDRENGTTTKHMALDGKGECDWDVEPAELNREEVNDNLRECKEAIRECKRSIKEIETHFGKSFENSNLAKNYPDELTNLETAEKELLTAQKIKDKIKGRTGKPEKRLRQLPKPPLQHGTCQFCLHIVPLSINMFDAQQHGFENDDGDVEECMGGHEPVIEQSSDRVASVYRDSVVEVLAREMALERDLIDNEKLVKFNRYLDRCRRNVDALLEPYNIENKEIAMSNPITDGDIKARALEVAYKQVKSEDAIERWPDMAEYTYEAVQERKENEAFVEFDVESSVHKLEKGSNMGWGVQIIILLLLLIGYFLFKG